MGGSCTERRRSGILAVAWLGVVAGPALAGTERSVVVSSAPAAFDRFGAAVDMSGHLAIVGSPDDDFAGLTDAGSAAILQRINGGGWTEMTTLTASDAADSDRFGWSVAISGQTAIVGAPLVAGFGSVTGAAYVFQLGGDGAWAQVARLEAGSFLGQSFFGVSVAIDGDYAVAGAHGGAGEAYLFHRHQNGTNAWGRLKKLRASDGGPRDRLGSAVSISGGTVAVAAGGAGAVYVFQRNKGGAGQWGEVAKITGSQRTTGDGFGHDIALDGNRLIVGAHRSDGACPQDPDCNSGSAYMFRRHAGGPHNWGEIALLTAADTAARDEFGVRVDLSGDLAGVGAWHRDQGATDAGATYLFERSGPAGWEQVDTFTASDGQRLDELGCAVAVEGNSVIAGAWRHGEAFEMAGAAYVFVFCPGDVNGDGSVGVIDLLAVIGAWGAAGGPADVDADGVVGITDALDVIDRWGSCT
ncbi:MAG: dockerin type I domain-containing protein [Planctomycetota bacterium]